MGLLVISLFSYKTHRETHSKPTICWRQCQRKPQEGQCQQRRNELAVFMLMNSPAVLRMHWTDTWIQTPSMWTSLHALQTGLKQKSWLQYMAWKAGYKPKICSTPTDFWKSLLTSPTSPSFWKYTLNFVELLSSHHRCFQVSIPSTDFLILFINNTCTFTLSITIITLPYHLQATKWHCLFYRQA